MRPEEGDSGYLRRFHLASAAREHGWRVDDQLGGAPLSDGWHASRSVGTTWIQVSLWPNADGTIDAVDVSRSWGPKGDRRCQTATLPNSDDGSIVDLFATSPDLLAAGGYLFGDDGEPVT